MKIWILVRPLMIALTAVTNRFALLYSFEKPVFVPTAGMLPA